MQGEGSNAEKAKEQRVPGDRIYRFATYNDLGKDSKEQDNIRQTLGGDQFPYPRCAALASTAINYRGSGSRRQLPDLSEGNCVYTIITKHRQLQHRLLARAKPLLAQVVTTAHTDGVAGLGHCFLTRTLLKMYDVSVPNSRPVVRWRLLENPECALVTQSCFSCALAIICYTTSTAFVHQATLS